MFGNEEVGDINFFVDGEKVNATVSSIDFEVEKDNSSNNFSGEFAFSNKEMPCTLKNLSIDFDALRQLAPQYDVVMDYTNYPRGNKLPKKKRIRNKWIKKYHHKTEFKNVIIH